MDKKPMSTEDLVSHHLAAHYGPYYAWIRHVVTLSSGTLTVLVALQSHYVPKDPLYLWLLQLCWLLLVLSILCGVYALQGEWQTPLDIARKIQDNLAKKGQDHAIKVIIHAPATSPRRTFSYAKKCTFPLYAFALFFLVSFAVLNL